MLNKRVLLAGLLSIGVIAGMVFFHNNVLYPDGGAPTSEAGESSSGSPSTDGTREDGSGTSQGATDPENTPAYLPLKPAATGPVACREVILETDLVRAVFSNRGAVLTSLELKDFTDSTGRAVELVLQGTGEKLRYPFQVFFSHPSENISGTGPGELFSVHQAASSREVVFSKDYIDPQGKSFTFEKTYTFLPGEYLFRLTIDIRPSGSPSEAPVGSKCADDGGRETGVESYRYDLTLGPRMGPPYEKQNARTDYRYFTLLGETPKKKNYLTGENKLREITEHVRWAGFHGQYFASVVMPAPEVPVGEVFLDSRSLDSSSPPGTVHFLVPFDGVGTRKDEYYCFFGPKISSVLARYSGDEKNALGLEEAEFTRLNTTGSLLGNLALFFGKILLALRLVVRNHGLAVLLFALLVRLITSPLSYKNFRSHKKLQALQPKITRIRNKHEFNKAEANRQIMNLYQKEQINSLGRLLPLLIQLPIIVALFQLFSRSFEFRNAPFITGWINTLSQPESVAALPFTLPFLGSTLRLLPIVMLAVTVVQIRISRPQGSVTRGQRIMGYATPVLIFLILYHMPSGIVLYWLFYNLLGIIEHFIFEKKFKGSADTGSSSKPETATS